MKPLYAVVFILVGCSALPHAPSPITENESSSQTRSERCTNCGSGIINIKSPNDVLAAIKALPGAQVHSQSSFEECSSAKGCAGIKVKDGRIVEKYGNAESFKAAAASDVGNEFSFHIAGANANVPFWWMNDNSPFKQAAGSFQKFSESSSYSTGNAGGANFGAAIDLGANPFLNGDFSKLASGFNAQSSEGYSASKPATSFQSSYGSSSFSSNKGGEVDISKNPFLNGGFKAGQSAASYQAGTNKFGGYTGSSPSPFTASTAGNNVNLIQSSQKGSAVEFEQQNQQNIDEVFQETGNVHAHEHSGGELQQTCAGQGYVCVHKAQCNNGVVNTNGAGILQAKTKKQYCNIKTEICCRIEITSLQGAGGLQGSLGVGSATFSGQGANSQGGGGLFVSTSQSESSFGSRGGSNFGSGQSGAGGTTGFGAQGNFGQSGQGAFGAGQSSSGFGSNSQSSFGSSQSGSFGSDANGGKGSSYGGQNGQGGTYETASFESSSFSSSNNNGQNGGQGGQAGQGQNGFNGQGQSTFTQGSQGTQSSFGQGAGTQGFGVGATGAGNRGTFESSSSSFESSSRGTNFGAGAANGNNNKFGGTTGFGATASGSSFGNNNNKFGNTNSVNTNEVIKTTNTQTNFVETDSFSSGTDNTGYIRPGSSGSGLKPGVPYLPPVDATSSGSSVVQTGFQSTTFGTTPRPAPTPRPYSPPSTSAPGYLPPEGEQTVNTETRVPPNPTYDEGQLILDETRQPNRPRVPAPAPAPVDIPAGCAAALKCTPIEFCTAEGVISNTTVALTRDQEAYRVPLTDCKDIENGRVGKCCRDPLYSDPWPTNLIGKWTQGVFGGNDGKYTPDSRGSPNNPRPVAVTVRPTAAPITGSVVLNNFRTTPKPLSTFGPNQVTPGFPNTQVSQGSYGQKTQQFEVKGQGQYSQGGQGQFAQGSQGQFGQGAQGQFGTGTQTVQQSSFSQSSSNYGQKQGQFGQKGQGQFTQQGQGQVVTQGGGQFAQGGRGQYATGGQGQLEIQEQSSQASFGQVSGSRGQGAIVGQGQGAIVGQGQGAIVGQAQGQFGQQGQGQFGQQGQGQFGQQGQGQFGQQAQGQFGQSASAQSGFGSSFSQGEGQIVTQGVGSGVSQGSGFAVSQGSKFGVENEYSETSQRVFLTRYSAGGECGVFNGQKPYGNRNELEVDFAEIPWQAMVLLQTNRSLLCGGVITRPDVVVTSASCVEGLQAKNVLIKGGEWKLGIDDEPLPYQIVQVKNILRHPFYKSGSLQYDAAILVLTENLRLAKNIYPICLPGAQETLDGFYNGAGECIVTGWGKQVLQAHLAGAIMHSLNISLINPGECQAKLSQDYPHLLEQYDQASCACGQPTNPVNNVCRVDIGSALACTTGDGHWVMRGIYSWDSGCQPGNQLAAFYKFDLEWYEWAIGLIESVRFAQFSQGSQISSNRFSGQINGNRASSSAFAGVKGGQVAQSGQGFGIKGSQFGQSAQSGQGFGIKGSQFGQSAQGFGTKGSQFGQSAQGFGTKGSQFGQSAQGFGTKGSQFGQSGQGFGSKGQFGTQYSQFSSSSSNFGESSGSGLNNFNAQIKGPIQNSFSASFSEKKVYQSEPKIITYTTKPEIVTFTTKPEIFTYTTKPKIVTYTTKPQLITYETSGSGQNPQYVAPGVTYNPGFAGVVGHQHNAQCKCLDGKK